MLHINRLFLLALAFLTTNGFAALVDYEESPTAFFVARKGNWDDPKNWQGNSIKPPNGWVRAYGCAGTTMTISGKVDNTMKLSLGTRGEKLSALHIKKGAKIKFGALTIGSVWQKNSTAVCYMEGGELELSNDKENAGRLLIGDSFTYSGSGLFEISGGKFTGGILVGSDNPKGACGTFSIVGSAAELKPGKGVARHIHVRHNGTLRFEFDEEGVSTFSYSGTAAYLRQGSKIVVDGKKYEGEAKTFVLLEADKIVDEGCRMEASGFPLGYKADIVITKRNRKSAILLKLSDK